MVMTKPTALRSAAPIAAFQVLEMYSSTAL
jgi:hypothetical protein